MIQIDEGFGDTLKYSHVHVNLWNILIDHLKLNCLFHSKTRNKIFAISILASFIIWTTSWKTAERASDLWRSTFAWWIKLWLMILANWFALLRHVLDSRKAIKYPHFSTFTDKIFYLLDKSLFSLPPPIYYIHKWRNSFAESL